MTIFANTCRHCKVAEEQGATHTHPTNEWRKEFDQMKLTQHAVTGDSLNAVMPNLKNFIQNLLDIHSAHLVEKIEREKRSIEVSEIEVVRCDYVDGKEYYSACLNSEYNQALDQAIDIVKGNNK